MSHIDQQTIQIEATGEVVCSVIDTGIKEREGVDRKLPDGWKWVKLGDCATFINGRAYKKNAENP